MECAAPSDVGQDAGAAVDDVVEVPADGGDDQMETESVLSYVTAASSGDERCGHCSNLYDYSDHKAMTGDCGHSYGRSCWDANQNACLTCSKVSMNLEPNYAIHSPRDLTSPEPLDPPQSFGVDGNAGPDDGSKMQSGLQQAAAGTLAAASHLVAAVAAAAQSAVGMVAPAAAPSTAPPPAAAPVTAVSSATSSTGAASGSSSTVAPARRIANPVRAASASGSSSTVAPVRTATPLRTAAKPPTNAPPNRAAPAPTPAVNINANNGMADITVKCSNAKTVQRTVNPDTTTLGDFKEQIWEDTGISSERQQLLYRGKPLSNNKSSLSSYKVTKNASHTMQMGCTNYGG